MRELIKSLNLTDSDIRHIRNYIKNVILKTITMIAVFLVLAACGSVEQDGPTWVALICFGLAMAWLVPFTIANTSVYYMDDSRFE